MSDIDWDALARNARQATNETFREEISTLIRLNDSDIRAIMNSANISNEEFLEIVKVVKDSTLSNHKKAEAIKHIDNGLRTLIGIAQKIV